jgi:hypothetical protein
MLVCEMAQFSAPVSEVVHPSGREEESKVSFNKIALF